MSHPLIAPDSSHSGMNALLRAAPNASVRSAQGFEAALEQARREESAPPKTAERAQNADTAPVRPREAEQQPNEHVRDDTSPALHHPDQTASETADNAADETAGPAGLPAEIAAILATLSPSNTTPNEKTALFGDGEEATGQGGRFGRLGDGLFATFTNSRSDASGSAIRLVALTGGAASGEQSAALGLTELPEFTLPSADTANSARSGQPVAGMSFAPRLEAAQQMPQLPITLSAGHRGWAAEVGNQVSWMVGRNEARAELQLTPPSLGKLGVSIQVNGEQTTAQFVAASQAARDALEQAMPRLREVLQQAGIELGETHVSTSNEQSFAHGDEPSSQSGGFARGDDTDADVPLSHTASSMPIRSGSGLVDTFA